MLAPRIGLAGVIAVCGIASLACGGRQSEQVAFDRWQGRGRECVRPFLGRDSPYADEPSVAQVDHPMLASVPPEVARTMRAAELPTLVAKALSEARDERPLTVSSLVTRQHIGMRLISLETQLAAVIFEAECTGELIEAMTFELEDRSDRRDLRLALSSLVVGAVSATVAGVWDLLGSKSKGPPVLGLTGGIVSAGLGGAAFWKRTQSMPYMHERNLIAAVVAGEDRDELFPRFVFRLLVMPAAGGGPSPRDRLMTRWNELLDEAVARDERDHAEALIYGRGGEYSQDLLALRERLYDVLESELNAQARDLELLDRFLVRALESVPAND